MIGKITERLFTNSLHVFSLLFNKKEENKWVVYLFISLLYFTGIYFWGKFTNWMSVPLNYHDWADINIPRIKFIADALQTGQLPLHMADQRALHYVTDRFFSLPDVITTPQMLVLFWLDIPTYVFFDIILHYTLCFVSLLWFRSRFQLSLFSFATLFFLISFNGYILAHYGVGHFTWASYFLFPAFFILIFKFLDGEQGWRWVAQASFLLFYMVLAGGQHHYVWLLIFLGFLMLTNLKRAKWVFAVGVFSGLMNLFRFLPPALVLDSYKENQNFNFVLGFPSISHIFSALAWPRSPFHAPINYFDLDAFQSNYWEFNLYVGFAGTLLLAWGIFQWAKEDKPMYRELMIPIFGLVALSLNSIYWAVKLTNFPLFASERVLSRMMGVPLVLLIILSVLFLEKYLSVKRPGHYIQVALASLFAFGLIDLWNNLKTWRLSTTANFFGTHDVDMASNLVANRPDPEYVTALSVGLIMTTITAVFLLMLGWREGNSQAR